MPSFRFDQEPGPYRVGLKVTDQCDLSRCYRHLTDALGNLSTGTRARPLQTLTWYPAAETGRPRIRVGDYVELLYTETNLVPPQRSARLDDWRAGLCPLLETSMWAVRDAPETSGQFPVVIYAPGFSNPSWDNVDLCEYLATHGYVVVASPSLGATSSGMTSDLVGVNAQARDISFLVGYAGTLPNTDPSQIAVVGFSWGGISNLFAAARDDRIRALVCLDGSLRFSPGLIAKAGDVNPEQLAIPLLVIAQGQWTPEEQEAFFERYPEHAGRSVLNAWTHGDLVTVRMLGLSHMEHCSMFQRNEDVWWNLLNRYHQKKGEYGREDGVVGYRWLSRYTLAFLDAYLKKDSSSARLLRRSPAENGVPQHVMTVNFHAAGSAPSLDTFRMELGRQGFACAAEVLSNFRRLNTEFTLAEVDLLGWSRDLLALDRPIDASTILKLAVELYPRSAAALIELGAAHDACKHHDLAVECYRQALRIDPMCPMKPELFGMAQATSGDTQTASRLSSDSRE